MMTPKERRRCAYELRAGGKTWAEVGRELGISYVRARQLVERHLADMRPAQPVNELDAWLIANRRATPRTRKVLAESGYRDLAALAAEGAPWLFKMQNIGEVTVRAVAEGLAALGLLEDANLWVAVGKKRSKSLRGQGPRAYRR